MEPMIDHQRVFLDVKTEAVSTEDSSNKDAVKSDVEVKEQTW
jgi:hypothetical protein